MEKERGKKLGTKKTMEMLLEKLKEFWILKMSGKEKKVKKTKKN